MKVILSGGGTAGHINPALALAEELKARGHEVLFAGIPTGIESRLVPNANIPFKAFEAAGFDRAHPATLAHALRLISKSTRAAKRWFREISPDVVVGFGGYVCIPVGRAAESMGIPVVVHEQNSVMGIANRYLAKRARAVALTYTVAGEHIADKTKLHLTGNPVRTSVFEATKEQGRKMLGIPMDARMLLVFGGSLGAKHLNTALCELKDRLLSESDLYIVHITGAKDYDSVVAHLALTPDEKKRWIVMDYQDRMGETLAACDMVVSRAGATSLAEISGRQIPALLVPFPYATADHQTMNAREYVDAGAAYMVADNSVGTSEFEKALMSLVDNAEVRAKMHAAAASFGTRDAASNLADVVISVVKQPKSSQA